ncbi:type II toxin -antitoxin system TacA 1-like antitoxin [Pseudomonas silesiensis]
MTRLNDEEKKLLEDAAKLVGKTPTEFARESVQSVIREFNETGKVPEWLERRLAP